MQVWSRTIEGNQRIRPTQYGMLEGVIFATFEQGGAGLSEVGRQDNLEITQVPDSYCNIYTYIGNPKHIWIMDMITWYVYSYLSVKMSL